MISPARAGCRRPRPKPSSTPGARRPRRASARPRPTCRPRRPTTRSSASACAPSSRRRTARRRSSATASRPSSRRPPTPRVRRRPRRASSSRRPPSARGPAPGPRSSMPRPAAPRPAAPPSTRRRTDMTPLRTIPRNAVESYLRALRWPVDRTLQLAGDRAAGAELTVDRVEATLRGLAGQALLDGELRRDAGRRHEAADEREKALRLRAEAELRAQRGEQEAAEKRERARARRAGAEDQRRSRERKAAQTEERRRKANAKAATATEEAIADRAQRSRLAQLDREAGALTEREEALTARDEAQRLGRAAARAKAGRKNGAA